MAGYFEYSKSNNAIAAEAGERYPATKLAKMLGVPSRAIKETLVSKEWHHTSKFYNCTEYYSLEEAQEKIDELKAWRAKDEEKIYTNCSGSFLEWGGTRKHPRASKIEFKNIKAIKKGKWFHLYLNDKIIKKGETTRGFHLYDERGRALTFNP